MSVLDLGLLRHVGLTQFEVKTIRVLIQTNGETAWYPARVKPETTALIQIMVDKKLVELVDTDKTPCTLRLTDIGRQAAAQVEASDRQAQQATRSTG